MKRLLLILSLSGLMANACSQSTLLWSEDYAVGLNTYYSDFPEIQTHADTIKVIGIQNTDQGQRLLMVKYDLNGDIITTTTFGSDSVDNKTLFDYKFDNTKHLYILQKEKTGFYKSKVVLQKYSPEGYLIWAEQIQNPADTSYTPHALSLVNDTCLFVSAYKEYDYPQPGDDVIVTVSLPCLYAFNSNGSYLWKREFNPETEFSGFAYDIFVHNNTAFIFTYDQKILKVDLNNNLTIDTNTGIINGINDVQLTPDNNLLITALTKYRVSKVNLSGSLIWTQQYGTNLPSYVFGDEMKATIQDAEGNIYITGKHYGLNYGTPDYTNADILTLKYDSSGNLIWQNRYEYLINNADIGNTICLKNGQIYVGGGSQSAGQGTDMDYVVLKIDAATGESTGIYRYDGLENGDDAVTSLAVFDNGNVALTGLSYRNTRYDWTTQLLSDVVLSAQNLRPEDRFQVYPNPIKRGDVLTITANGITAYSIISTLGHVVQSGKAALSNINKISINNLVSGMYFLRLEADQGITVRKIVVN